MTTKYVNDVANSLVQVLTETDNSGTTQAVYNYGNDLISMNRSGVNSFYHYDGLGTVKQLTDSSETIAASYVYDSFGNVISSGGATASNSSEIENTTDKTGIAVLASLGLGFGLITVKNKKNGLIALLCFSMLLAEPIYIFAAGEDTTGNSYGFTGESQHSEADGLVFLRARYYNPSIGRFISRDPILEPIQVKGHNAWLLPFLIYSPKTLISYGYTYNNPVNNVDPSGYGVLSCIKDALNLSIWDAIGLASLYASCVAGCGLVTGGVGVPACLLGCLAAVIGGTGAGLVLGCLGIQPPKPKPPCP